MKISKRLLPVLLAIAAGPELFSSYAATLKEYDGSRMPYPTVSSDRSVPDSLEVVMINHVGRHGARYPSSGKKFFLLRDTLASAARNGYLTPKGEQLYALLQQCLEAIGDKWGELDSVGYAEQNGIAERMFRAFPAPFEKGRVSAEASFVPRCVMSMYAFTHRLALCNENMDIDALSGPRFDTLLRPFMADSAYTTYIKEEPYIHAYDEFRSNTEPTDFIYTIISPEMPGLKHKVARKLTEAVYYFISSSAAFGFDIDPTEFMSEADYAALWRIDNLRQYLTRMGSEISEIPALIAKPLLRNLIDTTDAYLLEGEGDPVQLRFGHAETMMPLISLMGLPGYSYCGPDLENLYEHWATYNVVPMAANLQMILAKNSAGKVFLRIDYNEQPVPLREGLPLYLPWEDARKILQSCL